MNFQEYGHSFEVYLKLNQHIDVKILSMNNMSSAHVSCQSCSCVKVALKIHLLVVFVFFIHCMKECRLLTCYTIVSLYNNICYIDNIMLL